MENVDVIEPKNIETHDNTTNPPSPDTHRDMNFLSLKGFFGIDNPDPEEEDAMNWIYSQFEKMGPVDMAEVLLSIRDIERRISIPLGMSRVTAVRNYLKINSQIADLTGQLEAMR